MIYLVNKVSGEIKDVEPDTQEYRDLIAERTPQNKPVWEQQSDAAVAAKIERAEADALRDSDLPKDSQVTQDRNSLEGFGPAVKPWEELTDAEVELGLTPESKREQERTTLDTVRGDSNATTRTQAAEKIAGSETQRRGGAGVASDIPSAIDTNDGTKHSEGSETEEQKEARQSKEREEAEARAKGGE